MLHHADGASPIRRLFHILPAVALFACTADEAAKRELADVKSDLRAMRQTNEQLERRLARMEALAAIGASGAPSVAPALTGPKPAANKLPDLTVVKLKPKREPPPKLSVAREVVEPSEDTLEEILSEPAALPSITDPGASPALLEKVYDDGIDALKTGNVESGVERLRAFALDNPKHSRSDNALYFAGLGLIGLGTFDEAAAAFELLIQRYPASDTVIDAMLRLAECRVRLKQQDAARALYTKVIATYPGTAAATQAEQRLAALQTP